MSLIRGSVWLLYLARISAATDHAMIEDYTLEGEIRRHHVYKTSWTPVIGQILDVQTESSLKRGVFRESLEKSVPCSCCFLTPWSCTYGTRGYAHECKDDNAPFFVHAEYKSQVEILTQIFG